MSDEISIKEAESIILGMNLKNDVAIAYVDYARGCGSRSESVCYRKKKKKNLTAFYLYKNYIWRTKTQQKNKDPDRK